MISYLRGYVVYKDSEQIVLDVQGVGYGLYVSASLLSSLVNIERAVPQERVLWVHTQIGQDSLRLFGFSSYRERQFFTLLLQLPTVGPKLALAMISYFSPKELMECAHSKDHARLTCVPGVGRKKAEKILLELGSKLDKHADLLVSAALAPERRSRADGVSERDRGEGAELGSENNVNTITRGEEKDEKGKEGGGVGYAAMNSAGSEALAEEDSVLAWSSVMGDVRSALRNLQYSAEEIRLAMDRGLNDLRDASEEFMGPIVSEEQRSVAVERLFKRCCRDLQRSLR